MAVDNGVWRRAGMGGTLMGIDVTEALARITDTTLDRQRLIDCLRAIESGALEAASESAEASG